MKNWKIVIITTTIAILTIATIGVAIAHNYNDSAFYGGMMGYSSHNEDEDWWTEMQNHMDDHWDEVHDEEWFNEMTQYMEDHLDDIENQDWFDEMTQYMEERNSDDYGYHGCH